MNPKIARVLLGLMSIAYLVIYLLVIAVAIVTGGDEVVSEPGFWYAAIAPLIYVGTAGADAFRRLPSPLPVAALIAIHVLIAPALLFSLLGLGLLLPLFAIVWWAMRRNALLPGAARS